MYGSLLYIIFTKRKLFWINFTWILKSTYIRSLNVYLGIDIEYPWFPCQILVDCKCRGLFLGSEKAMASHSSTLAWKIPWTEEPGRLQSMGWLGVGHNWATWLSLFQFHSLEKEMATHSSVLAWRIPGTGEPGGLPSMGSHRVGHDWRELAAAAAAQLLWERIETMYLCV